MTSSDPEPKYVPYSNYYDAKSRFDKSDGFEHKQIEFENIIKDIKVEQQKLKLPDKIFIQLHKSLRNDYVFSSMHISDDYCRYVNYWLNKEVRSSYHLVNETNFDIFNNFLVNYNMNRFKDVNNSCYGYIKHLKDDVYDRMGILFYLYDKYNELKSFTGPKDHVFCDRFTFLGKNYKTAVDDHNDGKDFLKKLKELKRSIEGNAWASDDKCPAINYIKLPEPNPPKPIENSEESRQAKSLSQDVSSLQNLPNSHAELGLHNTPGPQKLSETQDNAQRDNILGSHFTANSRGNSDTVVENTSQYSSEQRGERGSQINSLYAPSLQASVPIRQVQNMETGISWNTEGFDRYKTMDTPEGSINVVDPNTHAITQEGLMGKIQGAFSSISEYVEPVPLMGVSGGMGALFLLLRYTPVGTFFRGGRGRAHRIPRSFNGQFLGAIPDFQDYELGHIGYGPMNMNPLAE
ncbi:PIR protein [Plasmodium vivax]|uniref:VIR protein n=1 Tax=Plasmodium vivax TaxID=5855 RepID=A0A565A593_PLAVI|nr:PIR protein [Plasmodium vivax]